VRARDPGLRGERVSEPGGRETEGEGGHSAMLVVEGQRSAPRSENRRKWLYIHHHYIL
jgi:hypothetical protein